MRQRIPLFLFVVLSGATALTYQSVWLREFRLLFGATTTATATVTAIFLGGLGLGGLLMGKRADRSSAPLRLYGQLELVVALSAAASPVLLIGLHRLYLLTGGSFVLGMFTAPVRILIAGLVLAIPTIAMGGTLPAAIRVIAGAGDRRRLGVALLIGANTSGAVAGALGSTFYLLEHLGNRSTLWAAALCNMAVAVAALLLARRGESHLQEDHPTETVALSGREKMIYAAAFASGFAFLTLEIVWNRLLTPILGGTTYTFGLTLAVALAGLAMGGLLFAIAPPRQVTAAAFAMTVALEALVVAIPFALGDRLAIVALLLRALAALGLTGLALGWIAVASVVVLPAAIVAGYQFPLLIALLGEGRAAVGAHVGATYAWNTFGTIAGSLLTGFLLLPLLTAEGLWRMVVVLLAMVSLAALASAERRLVAGLLLLPVLAGAAACIAAPGPTEFWRHSPIGAGRTYNTRFTQNGLHDFVIERRRVIDWESEGIESSVALSTLDGYAFIVNGKSDGHARFDAGTQVMGGIMGALLHPGPKRAAVVGLGTGSTAGWLGAVPGVERVDVIEIEPSIRHIAELCAPVNHDVMKNPKVHIHDGDGREFLMTSRETYDLISSEPSNPYRAGVATLFTTEFYRAVSKKLAADGLFLQFLQAYEVDGKTLRSIYASITAVFPHVQTWQTQRGDLLLVGSLTPIRVDTEQLRAKMTQSPYQEALWNVWRVEDVEGLLSHYVCGTKTARALAAGSDQNTDDRTLAEYGFARTLGNFATFEFQDLEKAAGQRADDLPVELRTSQTVNPSVVRARRAVLYEHEGVVVPPPYTSDSLTRLRSLIAQQYALGRHSEVLRYSQSLPGPPETSVELLAFADSLANAGDERVMNLIPYLARKSPAETAVVEARLRFRQGKMQEATLLLTQAFVQYRYDPWPNPAMMRSALDVAVSVSSADETTTAARTLTAVLQQPFTIRLANERRLLALTAIADKVGADRCKALRAVFTEYGDNLPWQKVFLERRLECATTEERDAAQRDLVTFMASEGEPLEPSVLPFDLTN